MLPFLFILAQAPPSPADNSGAIITGFVVAVIGAIGTAVANVIGKRSGRIEEQARRVTIDPQPLLVQLQKDLKDEFLPRREFDNFRADTAINFSKVEAAILRSTDRIDTKHAELIETIRLSAENGTKGRVAIWDVVNEQGRKIVATEAKIEIGERLERLGKELITTKQRRPHGS